MRQQQGPYGHTPNGNGQWTPDIVKTGVVLLVDTGLFGTSRACPRWRIRKR
jgi:hypothetical protein